MAIFIHGMCFLLCAVVRGASRTDRSSDAISLIQNRISRNDLSNANSSMTDMSKVNPYDSLGSQELDALGDILYGVPYGKIFLDIFKDKMAQGNNTKKMDLSRTLEMGSAQSMEDHLNELYDNFQQYKEAVVISNVFIHFDTDGDNKINMTELDAILAYLGEEWHDAMVPKLMHDLDRMSVDKMLQPTEFFFWFTWPALNETKDFDKKIADLKKEAKTKRKSSQQKVTKEKITDTIVLESSDVPKDPAEVKKVFGRFTQFQDALRILFFFKTFDSDWDGRVSKQEMTTMVGFLEPGTWSAPEIDSLMTALDTQTVDQTIGINEWFFWFTPTFAKVWEPAIRQNTKQKVKSQAGIPQLSSS